MSQRDARRNKPRKANRPSSAQRNRGEAASPRRGGGASAAAHPAGGESRMTMRIGAQNEHSANRDDQSMTARDEQSGRAAERDARMRRHEKGSW